MNKTFSMLERMFKSKMQFMKLLALRCMFTQLNHHEIAEINFEKIYFLLNHFAQNRHIVGKRIGLNTLKNNLFLERTREIWISRFCNQLKCIALNLEQQSFNKIK